MRKLLLAIMLTLPILVSAEQADVLSPLLPITVTTFDDLVYDLSPLLSYEEMEEREEQAGSRGGKGRGGKGGPAGGSCTPSLSAHPRIFVNTCTMTEILSKVNSGGLYNGRLQDLITEIDTNWTAIGSSCSAGDSNCGLQASGPALVYALYDGLVGFNLYSRSKNDFGDKAIEAMERARVAGDIAIYDGWTYGVVYDHTYNRMSAGQRSAFVTWFKTADNAGSLCQGPPPGGSNNLQNSQVVVCWATQTMAALAAKNDGLETTWVDAAYALYDEKFRDATGVTNFDTFMLGSNGGDPPEGLSYEMAYSLTNIIPLEEGWRTAHGISKATHYNAASAGMFKAVPKYIVNNLLPWDEGASAVVAFSPFRADPRYIFGNVEKVHVQAIQGLYEGVDTDAGGLSRWLQVNKIGDLATTGAAALQRSSSYILLGPSTRPTSLSPDALSLPLNAYLGNSRVMFREDWTSTDGGLVYVEAQKWQRGDIIDSHCAGGTFLFRNGVMTPRAGDGTNTNNPDTWPGSCSMMVFPDRNVNQPSEQVYDSQGRSRRMLTALTSTASLTTNSTYDRLFEIRTSLPSGAQTLGYVGQDLKRDYDSTTTSDPTKNPDRISAYWKDVIVSIQGDRVFTIEQDRTATTNARYVQTDMVLFQGNPTINGTETADSPERVPTSCPSSPQTFQCDSTTDGVSLGHWSYENPTLVTFDTTVNGSNGKIWLTPLLPASADIVKMGGPDDLGNSFNNVGTWSREGCDLYNICRVLDSFADGAIQKHYASQYRVEITADTAATGTTFLKVIELTASGGTQSTTTHYANGAGDNDFNCVRVGQKIGCLGEDGASKTSGDAILSEALTSAEGLWCNLTPSTQRTIDPGNNINLGAGAGVAITPTPDSAGCVTIPDVDVTAGSGADNTITVS